MGNGFSLLPGMARSSLALVLTHICRVNLDVAPELLGAQLQARMETSGQLPPSLCLYFPCHCSAQLWAPSPSWCSVVHIPMKSKPQAPADTFRKAN